jgi:hypothetical protein
VSPALPSALGALRDATEATDKRLGTNAKKGQLLRKMVDAALICVDSRASRKTLARLVSSLPRSSQFAVKRSIAQSMSRAPRWNPPALGLRTLSAEEQEFWPLDRRTWCDAGDTGGGGYWNDQWWSARWENELAFMRDASINERELFCVATSALTWGPEWKNKDMLFHCDNTSAIKFANEGSARNKMSSHLASVLHFAAVCHGFDIKLLHVNREFNRAADALAGADFRKFFSLMPTAQRQSVVPSFPPAINDSQWRERMAQVVSERAQGAVQPSGGDRVTPPVL